MSDKTVRVPRSLGYAPPLATFNSLVEGGLELPTGTTLGKFNPDDNRDFWASMAIDPWMKIGDKIAEIQDGNTAPDVTGTKGNVLKFTPKAMPKRGHTQPTWAERKAV